MRQRRTVGQFLSVRELAERLSVSTRTVERRLQEGAFRGVFKVGGILRIPEESVNEWIEQNNELVTPIGIGGRERKAAA